MIQIENLNKTYQVANNESHVALRNINLTIEDGSIFGIIGQSGAGKSTLVRCINLLERPLRARSPLMAAILPSFRVKSCWSFEAQWA